MKKETVLDIFCGKYPSSQGIVLLKRIDNIFAISAEGQTEGLLPEDDRTYFIDAVLIPQETISSKSFASEVERDVAFTELVDWVHTGARI